jgi:exoribonuclease-2
MKLVGAGFYEACGPERGSPGHFALAVEDYAHSTAPNRRYADIVTQRILRAAFEAASPPYTVEELEPLASRCTLATREAGKVERTARKAAIAMMLSERVGTVFDAVVTGAAEKGTWVRVSEIGAEGRLVKGTEGLDVGDQVRARLELADVELGHLDFSLA